MKRAFAAIAVAITLAACGESEPPTTAGPATVRRLTEAQYRNSIADIFGAEISIPGRLDPLVRTDGLLAVGASSAVVTPSAFERYNAMARSIAAQVVNKENRTVLVGCAPTDAAKPDDACASEFYARAGRLLFRRPLEKDELASQVAIARQAAATRGDFYAGLAYGLHGMLAAPDFLYVREGTTADGATVDDLAKASRLSFLLWNSTPDDALLTAAEKGELATRAGLEAQVDRMLASPRFKTGVRAFFTDMLDLDAFDRMEKDTLIFPAFTLAATTDAKEQTLRTLVDHLVTRERDYRDIFTTRDTFLTGALGLVYQVPVPRGWSAHTYPEGDERAGIHTQIGFLALHSHAGKSSPTLRGKAVRELLLCQKVPDPPGDVNFDQFNDPASPAKTARERLERHATDAACAGCHKLVDPVGLALENFDAAGQMRITENGVPIDTSGDISGVAFKGAPGLGKILHDDPAATACVVNRAASYAMGRAVAPGERAWVQYLEAAFADEGYRFPELIRRIALSEAFFAAGSATTSAEMNAASKTETKS